MANLIPLHVGQRSQSRNRHGQRKPCGHSIFTRCGNCGCEKCLLLPRAQRHISNNCIHAHGGIYASDSEDFQDNAYDNIQEVVMPMAEPDTEERVDCNNILQVFARRIILDVYNGQTQQETLRDLDRLQMLRPVMDPDFAGMLPRTYLQCIASADLPKSRYETYDVCQNNRCGQVFLLPGTRRQADLCQGVH